MPENQQMVDNETKLRESDSKKEKTLNGEILGPFYIHTLMQVVSFSFISTNN
jgi:hypothetical protein